MAKEERDKDKIGSAAMGRPVVCSQGDGDPWNGSSGGLHDLSMM